MRVKMLRASLPIVAGAALASVFVGVGAAQSGDPLLGTWKLNLSKSKFDPGPAPKASTLKYEAAGEGLKVVVDSEGAAGKLHFEYTAQYDGKDHPVAGTPQIDAVSLKKTAAAASEVVFKKDGKAVSTSTRVVSGDGKTLTITSKGTNAQGQAVNDVQVYDKQ